MGVTIQDIVNAANAAQDAPQQPQVHEVYNPVRDRERAAQQRFDAYREYQGNIRRAKSLRTDILKGARDGESDHALLMWACECIGAMTGDKAFADMVRANRERGCNSS